MSSPPEALPWRDMPGYRCFGCSPHNPIGLKLALTETPDGAQSEFSLSERYESYPGIIHGGIITTILDEVMGNLLVLKRRKLCFTIGLKVRLLRPVRVRRVYRVVASITAGALEQRGIYEVVAQVVEGDEDLVLATGSYAAMGLEDVEQMLPADPADAARLKEFLRPVATHE